MDTSYFCPDCRLEHAQPASAALGHRVACIDCALTADILAYRDVDTPAPAIAA